MCEYVGGVSYCDPVQGHLLGWPCHLLLFVCVSVESHSQPCYGHKCALHDHVAHWLLCHLISCFVFAFRTGLGGFNW